MFSVWWLLVASTLAKEPSLRQSIMATHVPHSNERDVQQVLAMASQTTVVGYLSFPQGRYSQDTTMRMAMVAEGDQYVVTGQLCLNGVPAGSEPEARLVMTAERQLVSYFNQLSAVGCHRGRLTKVCQKEALMHLYMAFQSYGVRDDEPLRY